MCSVSSHMWIGHMCRRRRSARLLRRCARVGGHELQCLFLRRRSRGGEGAALFFSSARPLPEMAARPQRENTQQISTRKPPISLPPRRRKKGAWGAHTTASARAVSSRTALLSEEKYSALPQFTG